MPTTNIIVELLYIGTMAAWVVPQGPVGAMGLVAFVFVFFPWVVRYRLAFGYQDRDKRKWDPWRP